ncbi:spermidine/putrescine ABC transporter substrate-binding protein [Sphaerisporangium krabiense]|uniref:Spermidine/putrescine transport system substrate-binding protein n=1 Tax=Sphaerisporangium krabiense TaxID=763782 RepID=A0A7W9DQ81_9ACTN|nr:spermidine/putrescine ABC transporter substrate-binding protein [Sphaerisporangium krabiense]MBB5626125.1 spermidine/putrescine transport system substrate-binding protein [Sphaerisporangium krabiense]GII67470.1 spermidine/putrescine ABC transporter substrate-binding protein [Sphaerisporangium krabiense]
MPRFRYTRRLPAAVAAIGSTLALAACGGGPATEGVALSAAANQLDLNADLSKQTPLNITIWENYSPKDLPQRVKDRLGFDVKIVLHDTNEMAVARVTNTIGTPSDVDVAFVSGQYAQAMNDQGWLAPIHPELIPNLANLYPEASQLSFDKGNKFSVPYTWGTTGLCYRTDMVKTPPTSWNDLLNPAPELRGKVTMMTTERWLALPALKALGYSINTTDDKQLAQAKDVLLRTKKSLLAYDDTTFAERLEKGEAAMVESFDGRCPTQNPKIKFVVPKEGSDLWANTMVIMKSSKKKEAAHAFINYILDPAVHSWVAENILSKVPNKAAMDLVARNDPDLIDKNLPLQMTPAELLQGETINDVGDAASKYSRLATEMTVHQ